MYTDLKGYVYLNLYASTSMHAKNVTMGMTNASGGFRYYSAWNFEGEMNLADHMYRNIYTFTDSDIPLFHGMILMQGNANMTVSNITIKAFVSFTESVPILGMYPDSSWSP